LYTNTVFPAVVKVGYVVNTLVDGMVGVTVVDGGAVVTVVDGIAVVTMVDGIAVVTVLGGIAVVTMVDGIAVVTMVDGIAVVVVEVVVLMVHISDELTACLIRGNQMKSKKYHSVGKIPKSNIKIVERGIIDIRSTHIHDRSLFLLDTYINCLKHKAS
jgi:lysylphosphatidylglycerol synthetase-like protein (DUF2156 family)